MYRLIYFIPIWLVFMTLKFIVALTGLIAIALMYRYRETNYDLLPVWTRPWANPEDWRGGPSSYASSLPKWWVDRKGITFESWYKYHAIRNPANGLRSFEWLDLDINPTKVQFKTSIYSTRYEPSTIRSANKKIKESHPEVADAIVRKTIWYLAWQGWRAGFKVVHIWNAERHLVIKLGWRIEPSDQDATQIDMGIEDASFASKFLPYRKG